MMIVGIYSFNGGQEVIQSRFEEEFVEVQEIIAAINAEEHKTKVSREKTMIGRQLYSPRSLNTAFAKELKTRGWSRHKIPSEYSTQYYTPEYIPAESTKGAFREMDAIKNRLGVEVQFGKYAFMVYNVCAKMTIFHNLDLIDAGIEIVPIKAFANLMSTGVAYFEQFVWDLEHRGIADIDIPVLILGITA
jgi:hypothetical protein